MRARAEAAAVCAAAAVLFAVASAFDAFERLAGLVLTRAEWHLDEVVVALVLLPSALALLRLRRAKTLRRSLAESRRADERYRAFVTNSSEAIWRFETGEAVPVSAPVISSAREKPYMRAIASLHSAR